MAKSELYDMRPDKTYVDSLIELVDYVYGLKKDKSRWMRMVEVGVYRGQGTKIFLDSGKIDKIYSIDPWRCGYDSNDLASSTDMTLVEKEFDEIAGSDSRVVKCKGVLKDYADTFSDIDFIYIDGNHQYDFVKDDIITSINVVKPSVAICGHDYHPSWSGVQRAVDETVGKPDKVFLDTSWIKVVKTEC